MSALPSKNHQVSGETRRNKLSATLKNLCRDGSSYKFSDPHSRRLKGEARVV